MKRRNIVNGIGPGDVIYTCPVHPDVKEAAPGKCPKCGMNLVKKG